MPSGRANWKEQVPLTLLKPGGFLLAEHDRDTWQSNGIHRALFQHQKAQCKERIRPERAKLSNWSRVPVSSWSFIVPASLHGTPRPCRVLGYGWNSPKEKSYLCPLSLASCAIGSPQSTRGRCFFMPPVPVLSVKVAASGPRVPSSGVAQFTVSEEPRRMLIACRRQTMPVLTILAAIVTGAIAVSFCYGYAV